MMAEEKKVEDKEEVKAKVGAKPTGKKVDEKPKAEAKKEAPKEEAKPEVKKEDTKTAKPVEKPKEKAAAKKKEKKQSYKISRSPEAKKLGKEKVRLEKKKGKFKRPNFGRVKKVPDRWRRPIGIDSRQQNQCKDKPPLPKVGYSTPKKVKGLHPTGYEPVRITNLAGLEAVDKKTQAVVLASSLGKRQRTEIQDKAKELGIQILNFKG